MIYRLHKEFYRLSQKMVKIEVHFGRLRRFLVCDFFNIDCCRTFAQHLLTRTLNMQCQREVDRHALMTSLNDIPAGATGEMALHGLLKSTSSNHGKEASPTTLSDANQGTSKLASWIYTQLMLPFLYCFSSAVFIVQMICRRGTFGLTGHFTTWGSFCDAFLFFCWLL